MTAAYTIPVRWRNVLLSVALVLVGWALPWVAWVQALPARPNADARPKLRVRYVRPTSGVEGAARSPILFTHPNSYGYNEAVQDDRGGLVRFLKPRLPDAALAVPGSSAREEPRPAATGSLQDRDRYRPGGAPAVPAFGPVRAENRLESACTGPLAGVGFSAPGLQDVGLSTAAPPWTVFSARVEVGLRGRVEHVFVEQSTGKADIDGALIKALYKGTVETTRTAVAGSVKVVYVGPVAER